MANTTISSALPIDAAAGRVPFLKIALLAVLFFVAMTRAAANPQISQGDINVFSTAGSAAPATGLTWDIVRTINGVVTTIATNTAPNGWTVSLASAAFTVSAPFGATVATNYEVRYKFGSADGPFITTGYSAYFDVIGAGIITYQNLALTAAGVSEGFALTTFSYGYPVSAGIGPFGLVFEAPQVLVSDYSGNVRAFPVDTDVQNVTAATIGQNFGMVNAVGAVILNDSIYMAETGSIRGVGKIVQLNANGSWLQDIVDITDPVGIVANPFTGHLYVSGNSTGEIYDVDPIGKSAVVWLTGLNGPDGMALSADGGTLYVAYHSGADVVGFSTSTGAIVWDYSELNPGVPLTGADGVSLGSGAIFGRLYVNTNSGSVFEVTLATGASTLIASGGTRGDFAQPDPNGTLLLTQKASVSRLTPPSGGWFADITSNVISTRDDQTLNTSYTTFDLSSPATSAVSAQSTSFNAVGVTGEVVSASAQRGGQLTWNTGVTFDLALGVESNSTGGPISYSPYQAAYQNGANPNSYTFGWPLPSAFSADIQTYLNTTYTAKLSDEVQNTSGSYALTDTPEIGWPALFSKNLLSFVTMPGGNPKIPADRCMDIAMPWTDLPADGTWEILLGQAVIASSVSSNGWDVETDHTGLGGAWVTVPSSAAVAAGYEVRGLKFGAGFFDVTAEGTGTYAPLLLPLAASPSDVVGGNASVVTVTLDAPAPAGGAAVSVTGNMPGATLPTSVTVPAGQQTAAFSVNTASTTFSYVGTIMCEYNGYRACLITVDPSGGAAPLAPTNLTATGGPNLVTLAWSASANTDYYKVKRSLVSGGPYSIIAVNVLQTGYIDKTAVNGTTYYYVVSAVNAYGESSNSNEAAATPSSATIVAGLTVNPSSVVGGNVSIGTVTL
ncbi:MAG TPA: hypothetical protein VGS41_02120, partial [Chthonomonadales bacterium]|nr:hypothetical protein [Chthonomonadales bacterium]